MWVDDSRKKNSLEFSLAVRDPMMSPRTPWNRRLIHDEFLRIFRMNTTLFQMILSEGMRVGLRIPLSFPETSAIRHSYIGSYEGSSPDHALVLRSKSTTEGEL